MHLDGFIARSSNYAAQPMFTSRRQATWTLTLVMDARKINSLTSGSASLASAASAARAQASRAGGSVVEFLLEGDLGTAGMHPNANPNPSPEHAALPKAERASAQVPGSQSTAQISNPTPPQPSSSAQTPSGVLVTLSTQALDHLATPQRAQDDGASIAPAARQNPPEPRAEAYPVEAQMTASSSSAASTSPIEPRSSAGAISQARDAERLAGLVVPPPAASAVSRAALDKLLLAAAILGALLLILL
jgi:hypothetical protein